jgi:site-specific recombinase XerD
MTNDIDIYTVSKLLGHKDLQLTQIYAKLVDEKKDEAIDKLPEL